MIKERGKVADADARRDTPRPHVKCGRGHRHNSAVQVTECDDRLALRATLNAQRLTQRKLDEVADEVARREIAARWGFPPR
jgi:hypothetical protein